MFFVDRVTSKPLAIGLTIFHIVLITFLDYWTGSEFSFSVFYLIPIALLAVSKTSSRNDIIIISFVAAICWYIVDVNSSEYSHQLFPIWNAVVRLSIFLTIGILVHSFRRKHDNLNEINATLTHLNNEKNLFIGIAAHDIRNPISAIYSFSDLLLNEQTSKINAEESEIIQIIKSLSQNILDLIEQLLDVSKIESGQIAVQIVTQDYISFVKKNIYINQLLAKPKQISIQFDTTNNQIMADFDAHYLSEVLNNLMSNAIKFSEKDSTIIVRVSEQNGQLLTEVLDEGTGIPLEEQNLLFNYFQKASSRPTQGESSNGLGLAIVKKVITACKGTVGVKSNLNEGSNFYFSFPIKHL